MKKPLAVLSILFVTIIVLLGVRTVVSTRITTSGLELGKVQDEIATYKTENTILKEKIFSLSSLNHVSEQANKNGFVESKQNFAITSTRPIARGQ